VTQAAMKPFFSLLEKKVLNRRRWHLGQDLPLAIATWIERTSHRRRRQRMLDRLTSLEFEKIKSDADKTAWGPQTR
jgi:putative transposase